MKLVYLLTTGGGRAGTEKAIADQTMAMSERGHDVTMVSVYRSDEVPFDFGERTTIRYLTELHGADGTPSAVIPREWDNQFCSTADRALLQYLSTVDADIVITSTPALMQYALLAVPHGVRVVGEEHRGTMRRGILAEPILRHGPLADAVVVLTERNAEWLHEMWGSDAPRIDVIPNSVPASGRPLSSGDQKVIMGAGRLVGTKGFLDLVRAFSLVAEDFPDWRLRIFGKGPQHQRIVTMIRNLGLDGRIELLPLSQEIDREWARASIGALASNFEGLPLVLLEALGAGIPLVANDCETGPREIISHGENGYLVPVGDIEAFADSLRLLMGDNDRRARMAVTALRSTERFSPEVVAEQWSALFADVMAQPVARRAERERALAGGTEPGREVADEDAPEEPSARVGAVPVTREDLTPQRARELTRETLSQVLAGTGIRCRPLQVARDQPSWAVRVEDRDTVIAALRDADVPGLEIRLYAGRARLDADGVSWRSTGEIDIDDVTRLCAYVHYEGESSLSPLHVGHAGGVLVAFWEHDSIRPDLYRGANRNLEVDLLSASQFDQPLLAPWRPQRELPLWSQVHFPIDAVYTWVDGSDPEWIARRAAVTGEDIPEASDEDLAGGVMRFRNRDELRYSLRSLKRHAPWIRNIYLVTDAQRPAWLLDGQGVTVVDHRELFPDPSVLPVFNSQAIESVLHRIPGISEQFIYLNDDGFFMRDQQPERYFTSTGKAMFYPSPTKINDLGERAEPHEQSGMNNRALIEGEFGVTPTQAMLHTPYPHRKSVLKEVERRFPSEIERTRAARFRSSTDVSLLSSLAQYWGYFTGAYQQGGLRASFVSLGAPNASASLTRAAASATDYLTFGEAPEDPDPEITQEMALAFMALTFPNAAPWEAEAESGIV